VGEKKGRKKILWPSRQGRGNFTFYETVNINNKTGKEEHSNG